MSNEYVFPDGHGGPLVRWSIANGAVHKDDRRVLTLGRIRKVLIHNLNGRVRVREVRLLLDDGDVVAFGSYGSSVVGRAGAGYEGFKAEFFLALADTSPEIEIDTEVALLPKFMFALFVVAMALLSAILAASMGNAIVALGAFVVACVGGWRGWDNRPWDSDRKVVTAADYVVQQ